MIIFRYLSREVLSTLLAATLILLIIFITNEFVHYLNDAADGKITLKAVMEVMTLQVPLLLGYLLPLSLFLGLLLTLGRFYVDHEMVVLSACGMSRLQLINMIMAIAIVITGIVAWLMLSVEPKMQWYRAKILSDAVISGSLEKIIPGRFQLLGNDGKVFYSSLSGAHESMTQVFLADKQNSSGQPRWDVVSAESAKQFPVAGNGQFVLFKKGFRYLGAPSQLKYDVIQFDEYGIRLNQEMSDLSGRYDAMPTERLWRFSRKDKKAAAELQWRIAMPLSVLAFALLAIPLSHVNPRQGKFAQLLPAILIYIVYANLLFIGRSWLEKGVTSKRLGLWWIDLLVFLLALFLLFLQSAFFRKTVAKRRLRRSQ